MIGFQRIWVYLAVAALVVVAFVAGGQYVYHQGLDAGRAEVTAVLVTEREAAKTVVAQVKAVAARESEASLARYTATLQTEKESHDLITRDLRAALDRSDLRGRALSADVASLLDAAARGPGGGTAAPDPGASGGPAGTPQADAAVASEADLIESVNDNYAICRRNAARLVELQTWYEALRSQNRKE